MMIMPKGVKMDWEPIDQYVDEHIGAYTIQQLAEVLGVNYGTLRKRTLERGISKFKRVNWTVEQELFLETYYPTFGGRYCADSLQVPITAVNKRANQLGLYYEPKDRYVDTQGYVQVGKAGSREYEHRLVMEDTLGRKLEPGELVHHKDGNKRNNHPDNLELTTRPEHIETHREDLVRGQRTMI